MIAAFLIFEAQGSLGGEVVSTKDITERIGKGGFEKLRGLKGEGSVPIPPCSLYLKYQLWERLRNRNPNVL